MRRAVALLIGGIAAATSARAVSSEPMDAGAVIAADQGWSEAEQNGDANYIEGLLDPGYVSVGPDGVVHDKATIVAHARAMKAANKVDAAARFETWRSAHPYRSDVALHGDVAVLSFVSTKPGSEGRINSSDIFIYRDGRWHAIYSQHSSSGS